MKKYLLVAVLVGAAIGLAPPNARAAINATLGEYTGDDSSIGLNIQEQSGGLLFTLTLQTPSTGAITGFWANLTPNVPMTGWSVSGVSGTIQNQVFSMDNVNSLGGGVNLNGGGSPAPLDFGVRFAGGPSGQSSVSFLLTGSGVTEAAFANAVYAARLQSLPGPEGSAKLVGPVNGPTPTTPVPDASSTVTLLGLSLFGIEGLRRRLMKS